MAQVEWGRPIVIWYRSGFLNTSLPDCRVVDTVAVIITTFGGALSATLGVLVGGVVTRRVQERHWLRDKQLRAYEELFSQYARFMMALRRAHLSRTPVDIDWGAWSVSLTSASLVAPLGVARAIDAFGRAIGVYLDAVSTRDPVVNPVDEDVLTEASRPAAAAHLALLNAIRRSMGRSLEDLPFYLGGTLGRHPEGRESSPDDPPSLATPDRVASERLNGAE
ncbi:hypothetical protein [Micromonospora sp. NPDC005173]|uniref:hypothetical protein n=1 Tax=Micromonospora sp. NPDC005173 TaxID=3157165 RepID=UPI0033AA5FA3